MNYVFNFEKLNVWVLSKDLAVFIYWVTDKFPSHDKYGIVDQIRRSTLSVSSNIAEGNSRNSHRDRIKYFNIAYSSLMESVSQAFVAQELNYLNEAVTNFFKQKSAEISNKLIALISKQVG